MLGPCGGERRAPAGRGRALDVDARLCLRAGRHDPVGQPGARSPGRLELEQHPVGVGSLLHGRSLGEPESGYRPCSWPSSVLSTWWRLAWEPRPQHSASTPTRAPCSSGSRVAVAIARVVRARTAPHLVCWIVVPLLLWIGDDSRRFVAGVACLFGESLLTTLAARGRPQPASDVEIALRVTLAAAAGITAVALLSFAGIYQ